MTNEVRKAKIEWQKQIATVLNKMLKEHPVSQEAVECGGENPLFEDTWHFVGLRNDIHELALTLKSMSKYSEIASEEF